jgi:hypothetical protein
MGSLHRHRDWLDGERLLLDTAVSILGTTQSGAAITGIVKRRNFRTIASLSPLRSIHAGC